MKIKVEFEAEVTDFHPARSSKEFSDALLRQFDNALAETIMRFTEFSSDIPLQNDLHRTFKQWHGEAKCQLTVKQVESEPTEVEKSYGTPTKVEE